MTGQTANTGQPSDTAEATETEGVPCYAADQGFNSLYAVDDAGAFYLGEPPESSTLVISSTAGSGVMVGTFTLWGYCAHTAKWYPITVNGGAALAELASPGDTIRYQQTYTGLGVWDRLFLQLAAVGGTGTAFEAWLVTPRAAP